MFGVLESLTKAVVAVAVTPVALVTDIVTLPITAEDPKAGPFDNTEKALKAIAGNLDNAINPNK